MAPYVAGRGDRGRMPHETLARNDFKSAERRPNRSLVIFGSGTRYRNAMLGFTALRLKLPFLSGSVLRGSNLLKSDPPLTYVLYYRPPVAVGPVAPVPRSERKPRADARARVRLCTVPYRTPDPGTRQPTESRHRQRHPGRIPPAAPRATGRTAPPTTEAGRADGDAGVGRVTRRR